MSLVAPALFPARYAGDRWGDDELTIDIAGVRFEALGLSPEQHATVAPRHAASSEGRAEPSRPTTIRVFRAPDTDFVERDLAGELLEIELDYTSHAVRCAAPGWMARVDWRAGDSGDSRIEAALWTCHANGNPFLDAFENTLRVLAAYRLLEAGGVLLHSAAAVDRSGRCHVFVGHSGAGKTTLSRLALESGRRVVSDDLNALSLDAGGRLRVGAVPFAGEIGGDATGLYPLAGLYRLQQGDRIEVSRLSGGEALATLLTCSPFVNRDPHRLELLENRLAAIVDSTAASTLTFPIDAAVWEHLDPEADRRD